MIQDSCKRMEQLRSGIYSETQVTYYYYWPQASKMSAESQKLTVVYNTQYPLDQTKLFNACFITNKSAMKSF